MEMKDKPKTLTPRLRFPEFKSESGWKVYSLNDIADPNVKWSFIGGPFGSNLKSSDYTLTGVRIIQLQNIGDGEFIDEFRIFTSQRKADELLNCNAYPGEIVLSKMGDPVGRACLLPDLYPRYLMCSDGIRFVVDPHRFDKRFIFFAINFATFRVRVESAATGSTRKRIGLDTLRQLPLESPAQPEQRRIAACLMSLDEWIAAEGRKLEALQAYKKGLMQQLFPREGETHPRLRFPELCGKPEWESRTMESISTIVRGGSPRPIDGFLTNAPNGLNWLKIGDVDEGAKYVTRTEQKVRQEALSKTRVIKPGDFILSNSMSFGRPYISQIDTCIHDGWIAVTEIDNDVDHEFLYYAIMSEQSQTYFENQAAGGGVRNLTTDIVKALPLALCDRHEQLRIAACLSSLDALIAVQSRKLNSLRIHKKGLMQQLFPVMDEVQG